MFFWKTKQEEKPERFSFSLLVLLLLFFPALLVVSFVRFITGRRGAAASPARQADKQNRSQEKTGETGKKQAGARAGKSPQEVKEPGAQKRDRQEQKPDDLTRIEGIGPKTLEVLRKQGITTFRQLADTSVDRLNAILQDAGFRMNPPDTWPEQARLAAEEQMEKLDAMQDRLHAGRPQKKS